MKSSFYRSKTVQTHKAEHLNHTHTEPPEVVLTIGKNLLSSNISSTCPHNMVNFGLLAVEIGWRVCGTSSHCGVSSKLSYRHIT